MIIQTKRKMKVKQSVVKRSNRKQRRSTNGRGNHGIQGLRSSIQSAVFNLRFQYKTENVSTEMKLMNARIFYLEGL